MKTILLGDDDPLLIDVYANKLKTAGFELEAAQTGQEILAKLKERKFDLLLLDIVLPEISGWEILKEIKNQKFEIFKNYYFIKLGSKKRSGKRFKTGGG